MAGPPPLGPPKGVPVNVAGIPPLPGGKKPGGIPYSHGTGAYVPPPQKVKTVPTYRSPDSPNFMPGRTAATNTYKLNPKTGVGSYTSTGSKAAPRPNTRPGALAKALPPKKGTPTKPNASATSTKYVNHGPGSGGGGGGGGGGTSTPTSSYNQPVYLTPQQLSTLAAAQAHQSLTSALAPYNTQVDQLNTQSAQHAQALAGFAKAMAQLQAPIGGNIADMYGRAADAVAGYGQGFSTDAAQLKSDAGAASAGANPNMTPEQQAEISKSYSGTPYDVMYGMNGYDPAQNLRNVGSALGANYSANLPAAARAQGNEWLGASQTASLKALQGIQDNMSQLQGKYPELYQTALNAAKDSQMKQESLDITAQQAGWRNRATEAGITGIDPVTNKPTFAARKAQIAINQRARQLGISDKRLKLALVKEQQSLKIAGKYHGMKKAQYDKSAGVALSLARQAHAPHTDKNGVVSKPVSWQQYLTGALKHAPAWIVIEQGRRVYSQAEIRKGLIPGDPIFPPKKKK